MKFDDCDQTSKGTVPSFARETLVTKPTGEARKELSVTPRAQPHSPVPTSESLAEDVVEPVRAEQTREPLPSDEAREASTPTPTQEEQSVSARDKLEWSERPYDERREIALKVARAFAGAEQELTNYARVLQEIEENNPTYPAFDRERIAAVLHSMGNARPAQQCNVFAACVLFRILNGSYPQDCWGDAIVEGSRTRAAGISAGGKALAELYGKCGLYQCEKAQSSLTKRALNGMEGADIALLASDADVIGATKLNELFWEVFVDKYGNYKPSIWEKKLEEFKNKTYELRENCEYLERREGVEIFAASYQGGTHVKCEDYSLVRFYDDQTWLAVSADGVGSCLHSFMGSELAVKELESLVGECVRRSGVLGNKELKKERAAALMYYFRFELAHELYLRWSARVERLPEFKTSGSAFSDFSCTLQFAFGCSAFIACGRVGDGSFYVRKREELGGEEKLGGFMLNDGISGVTQAAVHTVVHLNKNPRSLQTTFFHPEEVADIVISSDGVSGSIGESVEEAERFLRPLDGLDFETRCGRLSRLAKRCSDYNVTQCGSGDDSTLVHIRIKKKQ